MGLSRTQNTSVTHNRSQRTDFTKSPASWRRVLSNDREILSSSSWPRAGELVTPYVSNHRTWP